MKTSPVYLILIMAVGPISALAADFDPVPFGFFKETGVKMESEGIAAFPLDSEVFEQIRGDYSNLRLVRKRKDNHLEEVPFLREKFSQPPVNRRSRRIDAEDISLQETQDNRIEITVRLRDKKKNAARAAIDTPLRDFECGVSVSGSPDRESWMPLVTNERIFDYSRYLNIRKTEIALPKNDYRYFKVIIDHAVDEKDSPIRRISRQIRNGEEIERKVRADVTSRPFRIDSLNWYTEQGKQEAVPTDWVAYPLSSMDVKENSEKKETEVLLQSRKQPLTRFTLVTGSKNFRREFSVQTAVVSNVSGKAERWKTLRRDNLFRYDLGDFHESRLTMEFPEQRAEHYRIVIQNYDDPPLHIDGFEAGGPVYRLLCLAAPGDRIRLYFGGDEGQRIQVPAYESSAILAARGHGLKVTEFPLGSLQVNPTHQAKRGRGISQLSRRAFFWTAITLAVALLAWVLFSMSKKIENLPDE